MGILANENAISSGGYNISNSLRFQSASSQYLARTPASAGNRQTWTWSAWIKKSQILADSTDQFLLHAYSGSGNTQQTGFAFASYSPSGIIDSIRIQSGTQGVSQDFDYGFANTYRDPASWYHIVVAFNTTNATASNRCKVYVNGNQLGSPVSYAGRSTTISQNYQTAINNNISQNLGRNVSGSSYFDGDMTEVNFIDGQALTPSSFGNTDATSGQWVAKKYTGTYGTNGFYLPFSNGTSTTTLGADSSGNSNNWTLTNFTRSAGVSDCWMKDVPSGNGSAGTQPNSNYCVLNPLDKDSSVTISKANLTQTSSSGGQADCSIEIPSTGKWYVEYINTVGSTISLKIANDAGQYIGYLNNGNKETSSGGASAYGSSWTTNDVIAVAVNCDASTVTFYKNNVSQGALNFSIDSISSTNVFFRNYTANSSAIINANFGQRSWAYTPPTGFKALCTSNLASTTVATSGSFVGNVSTDGPFIWCNGTPETLTINGNAVTFGTQADRLSNGFKLITTSTSYNSTGTNTWTSTILSPSLKSAFKNQNAKGNP